MNIFTIPSTSPFLDTLAKALLEGRLPGFQGRPPKPLELAEITLLLPTRRACRSMLDAFLRQSGGQVLLTPRIEPIGDIDEDQAELWSASIFREKVDKSLEITPAIGPVERHLVLTQFVLKWMRTVAREGFQMGAMREKIYPSASPSEAALLARDLAKLMDETETELVDLAGLKTLVPESYSDHWQLTLEFLKIITLYWPAYLQDAGLMSVAHRRNAVLALEAERLESMAPKAPIIAAGITGSIPATIPLLKAITKLPNGTLILPALDMELDKASWDRLAPDHPEHPQYGMKSLLDALAIERSDVRFFGHPEPLEAGDKSPLKKARARLISEALRPAESSHLWQDFMAREGQNHRLLHDALEGISLMAASNADEEAELIALILRQVAESPGKRGALVTPDRLLARRVSGRLERWGLVVDDSAGRPLAKSLPGVFFDLIIDVFQTDFAPSSLMALLKHPLTRLGLKAGEMRGAARALELISLRQPISVGGIRTIEKTLMREIKKFGAGDIRHPVRRRIGRHQREQARASALLSALEKAFEPLLKLRQSSVLLPLSAFVGAHIGVAEALAERPSKEVGRLWQGDAGEAMAHHLAALLDEGIPQPEISSKDYPEFYRALLVDQTMRDHGPVHPRLFIWGPLEARLQHADIMILGGLNEGTWPAHAETGPWLSRAMREGLGLPSPEQSIGLSAHDFSSLLGAERVYLTRAEKRDGVPMVPSRWLLRLDALLTGLSLGDALDPPSDMPWLHWARARDQAGERPLIRGPQPTPPVALRPRRLSVTQVETWIKNPYAIYARYILKLEMLPPLGEELGASIRGVILHDALHHFTKVFPGELPEDPAAELMKIIDHMMADYIGQARVRAFWRSRFMRFVKWFTETEAFRRKSVERIFTEVEGALTFKAPFAPFQLTARADRIDLGRDGQATIYDYKTGVFPSDAKVKDGRAPQLSLEGALLAAGGFENISSHPLKALHYISAKGGEPPGIDHPIKHPSPGDLALDALEGLKRLVDEFDQPTTPYRALRRPQFKYLFDDYAHLARLKEWAGNLEENE